MELSSEDALRLNVMLANDLQAVRIDESSMTVYGLSAQGETAVKLNPNCRDEQYIKRVKELFSTQVLGSPGGYPVYLKRWTRMGQARDNSLENLLKLGESEAVVAVVHARGINEELARRAWWAMPSSANARKLLAHECVANSEIGREMAAFLIEFLPLEESHQDVVESVRLVLQPGLIDDETRQKLWDRGRHKNTHYVGFLHATPDELPDTQPPHPAWETARERVQDLVEADNSAAAFLSKLLSPQGQTFLNTVEMALRKPNNQDVVVELLEAIRKYFSPVAADDERLNDMDAILAEAGRRADPEQAHEPQLQALLERAGDLQPVVQSMCVFAGLGERVVAPIFARTDAIGSVMRRKIEPITRPMHEHLAVMRGRR